MNHTLNNTTLNTYRSNKSDINELKIESTGKAST
jgi:hypothetical protein